MLNADQRDCRNRLLTLMSREDFGLLAPDLERVESPKGSSLTTPDRSTHVYFPESGIVSVVTTSPLGHKLEAGLFGRDGFGPVSVMLGSETIPCELLVQVTGECYRMPRAALVKATNGSASLRDLLLRYVQALWVQTTQIALSNTVHAVEERLARWILMIHDRSDADEMVITHDAIAHTLSVRRPSVTTSLHMLEGRHLIRSERGHLTVRDRIALERLARDSYGAAEAAYRRLIGPMWVPAAAARQPEHAPAMRSNDPQAPSAAHDDSLRSYHERRLAREELKLASAEEALASGGEATKWKLKSDVTKLRSTVLRLEATLAQG